MSWFWGFIGIRVWVCLVMRLWGVISVWGGGFVLRVGLWVIRVRFFVVLWWLIIGITVTIFLSEAWSSTVLVKSDSITTYQSPDANTNYPHSIYSSPSVKPTYQS